MDNKAAGEASLAALFAPGPANRMAGAVNSFQPAPLVRGATVPLDAIFNRVIQFQSMPHMGRRRSECIIRPILISIHASRMGSGPP